MFYLKYLCKQLLYVTKNSESIMIKILILNVNTINIYYVMSHLLNCPFQELKSFLHSSWNNPFWWNGQICIIFCPAHTLNIQIKLTIIFSEYKIDFNQINSKYKIYIIIYYIGSLILNYNS